MARPKGHLISEQAFNDLLQRHNAPVTGAREKWNFSKVAAEAKIKLTTLSGLLKGDHGASEETAERIALALGCSKVTLFPSLGDRFDEKAGFRR